MFRYKILLFAIACLAAASNCFAITDEAIFRSFEFSFLNPGARSGAMGGAFIALADDATAAEANPAGLTILTKPEVSFEYRHTETNANELNSLRVIDPAGLPPDFQLAVETFNEVETQDQPSFVSVVFPASNWVFGFSRQEFVKQDAIVFETILTSFGGGTAFIQSRGFTQQDIVNWNFSTAVKLSESFSMGATVRYSQLDWNAFTENAFVIPGFDEEIIGSQTSIDDSDSAVGFNVGGLWKSKHASFGAVYKYNPTFEVTELEDGIIVPEGRPSEFTNVLNVPDTFGGGVAIKPNDTITVSADVTYIKFSDLEDDFQAGHSVFTLPYEEGEITFKVDNGFDYRVGSEFIVFVGTVPVALRAGYYRKASNSVVTDFIADRFPADPIVLPLVFAEREDTNHFTFGSGFVFGQNFQVDWAMDTSNLDDAFILSSVVRF